MPKRITNPLRSGLPSKIYLVAYGKPISGYEIARRVYGTTPAPGERARVPPTAKVYGWLKKLERGGLIKKLDKGYLSQAAPLIDEIEKTLEVHTAKGLTILEKKILIKILDSKEFRSYVNDRTNKIDLKEDIDAARELSELLIAPIFDFKALRNEIENPEILQMREPTTIAEFNELWNKDMLSVLKERFGELAEEIKTKYFGPYTVKRSAIILAKKKESSLKRDFERIMAYAKDAQGLLALKFACVPPTLLEEIMNLSVIAVAAKRVIDSFLRVSKKTGVSV